MLTWDRHLLFQMTTIFFCSKINQRSLNDFSPTFISFNRPGGSGLKWTVLGQSERSRGVKLDGPNDWKWTVLGQSGRSKRLKVDGLRKWTVLKSKSGRSKGKWPYDLKYWIWTVSRDKSGRSKGMKLDGLKESKWTVPRAKTGRSKR